MAKESEAKAQDHELARLKVPPQSTEAEQAVLGGILLDPKAFNRVTEILEADDFYQESHRLIFQTFSELSHKNETIDSLTIQNHLTNKEIPDKYFRFSNYLEAVGGITYLATLLDSVPTAANITAHARIVKEKSVVRRLISTITEVAEECYENYNDIEDFLNRTERSIFEVTEKQIKTSTIPLETVIKDTFKRINTLSERDEGITGVPSGFYELDEYTSGFQNSELIIVAGRPSMGKTAFGLNVALNAAKNGNVSVGVFSLEMSKEELGLRFLCMEGLVDSNLVRKGKIGRRDWSKLTEAAGNLSEMTPVYIDDTPALRILELQAKARRLKAEKNVGMIIVDYLQLIRGTSMRRNESREQEISEISRSLKALAKELGIPVIALSQLSRAVEGREIKRPRLSDLRESGAIEQDADVVLFIYRDDVYKTGKGPDAEQNGDGESVQEKNDVDADIIIGKQRNGPIGTVTLLFRKKFTRFENLEKGKYRG